MPQGVLARKLEAMILHIYSSGHCCEAVIITALYSQPSGVPPSCQEAETLSVYRSYLDGLTKTWDSHVSRSPPKDTEKLYFNYFEKAMQCLEYKVKKNLQAKNHNPQQQTNKQKMQLLSLAAISVVFGFLFTIIQSLALLNEVNIANKILSSLEKLCDEKFCLTVSENMSVCLQLSVHHRKQHFKNYRSSFFSFSLLSPS